MRVLLTLCGAYLVIGAWWAHQWGWYPDADMRASWGAEFGRNRPLIIAVCIVAVVLAVFFWPVIILAAWNETRRRNQ